MKMYHKELSIDMLICRGIFKNNQMTLFLCFTLFIRETGIWDYLKIGVSFYTEKGVLLYQQSHLLK